MTGQLELVRSVKAYDLSADEETLTRAYNFAKDAHKEQRRASGEPYFSHPLEVAGILTEYKLDTKSIVTALLHDTIEDTKVTSQDIADNFGREISELVEGVTKLTQIELQSGQSDQAENFRKLVLAMSEDIRVLLVKLADRLHNMRTLKFIVEREKRHQIALETMEIYAPLAERLGMEEMKNELEDLAFSELHSDARESITARLQFLREQGKDNVDDIVEELKFTLSKEKLRASISGRQKSPFSIWLKTQKKNISFEQISDIIAFRIVVESVPDCYRALGIINQKYRVIPGRIKDFISTPKPNGYESLHTSVIGPKKQRIEIQIRTRDMHEVSEIGVAAHWLYKQDSDPRSGKEFRWMRELLEILENAASPDDFLEHTKMEMFPNQVFCFTPVGDVIVLPSGATPVDFAYAVHSEIGDHCVGATVNSRSMPLRTELENGDQVEIITADDQTPSPTWESFVVSGKARAHIRKFVRSRERNEYISLGKAIVEQIFVNKNHKFSLENIDSVFHSFGQDTLEDLLAEVGAGLISGEQVFAAAFPNGKKTNRSGLLSFARMGSGNKFLNIKGKMHAKVAVKGMIPGMALHYADCCNALPGDRIIGLISKGKGVVVHTIDCEMLEDSSENSESWIDLSWSNDENNESHVGRISLLVANSQGSLGKLCTVIGANDGNISNLKITNRTQDFFSMWIDVEVSNVKHLKTIIAALRSISEIKSVKRDKG